jgi:mannose/fructose/N-acetylgalactosamine-specific phosphotransferase system component IID
MSAVMSLCVIFLPSGISALVLVFVLGGTNVALEETLEDSMCAELTDENFHGTAFGVLAAVNGIGDFLSSIIVGALWSSVGITAAFGYSAFMSVAGALLVLRVPSRPG